MGSYVYLLGVNASYIERIILLIGGARNGLFMGVPLVVFGMSIRKNEECLNTISRKASDNDFNYLELYFAVITVATFIAKEIILPITIDLVAIFLIYLANKHHRETENQSAEVNIIVAAEGECKKPLIQKNSM